MDSDKIKFPRLSLRGLPRIGVVLHLTRPPQKPEKLPLLFPEDIQEIPRPHRIRLLPRVRLQPPPKIRTLPRSQPITARRIPQKLQLLAHSTRPYQVYALGGRRINGVGSLSERRMRASLAGTGGNRSLLYNFPAGVGIEHVHCGRCLCRGLSQILFEQHAILVDHESHHA
jgi:hypothetical protein